MKDGRWECGEGVATADDSIDGGELDVFGLDGLMLLLVRDGFGGVALLGLIVGDDVEDNGPPGTVTDAGLLLLIGSDDKEGTDDGVLLFIDVGLWDAVAALVTGTVVATELVAATTATDDSPEMAVAAVVSA